MKQRTFNYFHLLLLFFISGAVVPVNAQQENHQEQLIALSQEERQIINTVSSGDGTPLIRAAKSGELAMVIALIHAGADVNQASDGDGCPLIMAAKYGHLPIVQYLLEHGADIDQHVIGDETPLIQAAGNGHLDIVVYLVEKGADVNIVVRDSYTLRSERRSALLMARRGKHVEIVNYLMQVGAKQ